MAKNKGMVAGKGSAKTAAPSKVSFTTSMSLKKDTKPGETGGAMQFEADEITGGAEFNSVAVASVYVRKEKVQKVYKKAKVTVELFD